MRASHSKFFKNLWVVTISLTTINELGVHVVKLFYKLLPIAFRNASLSPRVKFAISRESNMTCS